MPLKPRILVVTSTFPHGPDDTATPPFVLQLCSRLIGNFDVDVLAPHSPRARAREEFLGVNVIRYRYAPARLEVLSAAGGILAQLRVSIFRAALIPLLLVGLYVAVWRQLRRHDYAAVHAHWLIPQGLIAAAVLRTLGKAPPLVITVHGTDALSLKSPVVMWLKKWAAARAAVVTTVSTMLRDHLTPLIEGTKVRVLPMGVDLERLFVPSSSDVRKRGRILFVGRLVEKKGVSILLAAVAKARSTHPHAHLWLVGAGPEESSLRLQTKSLGLEAHVRFCGSERQERVAQLYRQAEIVVFPSLQEGLGLVPIEALGCECAVLASDIPAVEEIVLHEVTGLLTKPACPDQLAIQLRRLLDDPDLRRQLGKQGRQHVLRFDWKPAAQAYSDLLASVIRTSGAAPGTSAR